MVSMKIPPTVIINQPVLLNWTRDSDQEVLDFYLGLLNDTCTACATCQPSGCPPNGQLVNSNHALSGQITFQFPSNITAGRYRVVPLNAQGTDTGGASNVFTAVLGGDLQSTTSKVSDAPTTPVASAASVTSTSTSTSTSSATSSVSASLTTNTSVNTSSGSSTSQTATSDSGTSTGIPTTTLQPSSSTPSTTKPVGIIAGVTVGTVFVLIFLILVWWYRRRRATRFSKDLHSPTSVGVYNDSQADFLARPALLSGWQSYPLTAGSSNTSGSALLSPASAVSPTTQTLSKKSLEFQTLQSKTATSDSLGFRLGNGTSGSHTAKSEIAAENARLKAEIQRLREQYDSQGITDELPPEYPGTVPPP